MPAKIYLRILRYGVYLSFASLFLVFNSLLFPYITSKQIAFNILIEILTAVWLVFLIQYPNARPKFSYVSFGLLAFILASLISSFFGVDFNMSFWGNIERMLGWFHLFHFFLLYLIIITVFRSWKDWKKLYWFFLAAAFYVSLIGIFQRFGITKSPWGSDRVISSIGNAAYVGAFAIFSIYFSLIMIAKEKITWLKYLYGFGIFLNLLVLIFSGTRGAYAGLGLGVLILFLMLAVLGKNKTLRLASISLVCFSILVLGLVFANKNSTFVQNNSFLRRVVTSKLSDATVQTRLISWRAALDDFPHHPVFGTGYGNFAITFDKYFDPSFYNFTTNETYFDRAHNNLVDITSTTGLAGLLTYLSIFAAAGFYLIRAYRKEVIGLLEFSLISTLIIAYFIQNLFVFDALATYIPLMVMLGYIDRLSGRESPAPEDADNEDDIEEESQEANGKTIAAAGVIAIFAATIIYNYNVLPLKMLKLTIDGQYEFTLNKDVVAGYEAYKKALAYNTPLDRDSRKTLVRSISGATTQLASLDPEKQKEIVDYAIEQGEKNVALNPNDSMNQMILAQMFYTAMLLNQKDANKFSYYTARAEESIDKSIEASPGRVTVYFTKAQIYLGRGDVDGALKIINYAISLNPKYPEGNCYLSRIYLYQKKEKDAYAKLDQCLDAPGGDQYLNDMNFIGMGVKHYQEQKDWKRLTVLMSRAAELNPQNASYWIELAKLYASQGDKLNARDAALKAVKADPAIKDAADEFIRQLGY